MKQETQKTTTHTQRLRAVTSVVSMQENQASSHWYVFRLSGHDKCEQHTHRCLSVTVAWMWHHTHTSPDRLWVWATCADQALLHADCV